MKRLFSIIGSFYALLAVVGVFSVVMVYGEQKTPVPSADKEHRLKPLSAAEIVERMKKELDLSEAQVKQILPVIEEEFSLMRSLIEQDKSLGRDNPVEGMEKMKALRENTEKKLALYLTQEQLKKWQNDRPKPPGNDKRTPTGEDAGVSR